MQDSAVINKYLQGYAESEVRDALALFTQAKAKPRYQHCLCIPAYDESPDFLQRLAALAAAQPGNLYIIVINQPDTGGEPSAANLGLLATIARHYPAYPTTDRNDTMQLHALDSHSDMLVVDRCARGRQLAANAGVGQARKIAADIALQLMFDHRIRQPFIFCSDADAHWPDEYFDAVDASVAAVEIAPAALLYPFKHADLDGSANQAVCAATRLYERRINAYVAGLQFAGSAYAYHTLGSTLCISARHYAMVRGFPRRAAGEDFYILNKLRKTGPVLILPRPVIALAMRASARTPFGTGPAVAALADTLATEPAIFYHPELFVYLQTLLRWFVRLEQAQAPLDWREHFLAHLHSDSGTVHHVTQTPLDQASGAELMIAGLEAIGFTRGFAHCQQQASDATTFGKHLFCWFDAFKTLKWLHHLRAARASLGNIGATEMSAAWRRVNDEELT